jgi:hypothetical protein
VKQFTQRIYGLPASEFFARHEALLTTLRHLLAPDRIAHLGAQLLAAAQPLVAGWQQQQGGHVELWSACQSLVFAAAGQVRARCGCGQAHGVGARLLTPSTASPRQHAVFVCS